MQKTVGKCTVKTKKTGMLEKLLIMLAGISVTIGESMNSYFSFASKLYVFIGTLLVVFLFIRFMIKQPERRELLLCFPWTFLIMSLAMSIIILGRVMFQDNLNSAMVLEEFKPVIFLIFSCALSTYFVQDKKLLDLFLKSFLIAFVLLLPFGKTGNFNEIYRFSGTYSNPNTYALECIVAIFVALYFLKKSKNKIFEFCILAVCAITLLSTGSRGGLLAVLLGFMMIFIFTKSARGKLAYILLGCMGIILLLLFYLNDTSGVFYRLFEKAYSGNVRLEIWKAYLKNIDKYMWFGMEESKLSTIHYYTPHSAYLGIWVRYGLFTFVLYIVSWFSLLFKSYKVGRRNVEYETKVLSALFFSYTLSGMTIENVGLRTTWIVIALVIANVNEKIRKMRVVMN